MSAGTAGSAGGPVSPVWRDPRVERGMERQFARLEETGIGPVGWKLGLGNEAAMQAAGTSGALLGYLTAATGLEDGASIDIGGWQKAAIEPELVIYLGADVAADAGRDEAEAAIASIGMALEIVDIDLPLSEVEELLAGDIFHRHYVLGPGLDQFAGGRVDGIELAVGINGEEVANTSDPTALVGDLVDLTRHASGYLAACGRRLEAGQFIISGAVIPPLFPAPGDNLTYDASALGELSLSFM